VGVTHHDVDPSADLRDLEWQVSLLLQVTIAAQEEERERICLEIHDGVAQKLAAAFQYLQTLENYPSLDESVRTTIRSASALTRDAIREAREVISSLRPATLDTLGLAATLRYELAELAERTVLSVDFEANAGRFPKAVETTLYRIIHEAVANAAKHAHANHLVVHISEKRDDIVVKIQDDGIGFEPSAVVQRLPRTQIGLLSMRKRAELLHGSCEVRSSPGCGTQVCVTVPTEMWQGQALHSRC
jgi:two-component system sensor histidine kinase DegS